MERYRIEPLSKVHDRGAFSCGVPPLDRYLKKQATQDARRKIATSFVAVGADGKTILGYYTLSMAALSLRDLPEDMARKFPSYPSVPAVKLGRVAVAEDKRGKGLGTRLLMDAMHRVLANEIAWAVFLVDARDETARTFYLSFGFQSFADHPKHMFLPRRTIEKAFEEPKRRK